MSMRIVTHAVALPGPRRRRTNVRAQMAQPVGLSRSGLYGVKHHQPVERVCPEPARRGPARVIAWPGPARSGWFARFQDDRDLIGMKAAIVGLTILIVMMLEVPW
jgi:hypothetical protein